MRNSPIKVFIVDDHQMVIEGIKSLLFGENHIELVGCANTAQNCLQFFKIKTADVILMDINLPDTSGIELCDSITKKYQNVKVIALSTHNQGTYVRKMIESGAKGYLLKNADKHEILKAIETVSKGSNYLTFEADRALRYENELQNKIPKLTKREKEILILIAEGLTNIQISEKLFISTDTVDSHRKNLHTKLNVKNTAMLIRFATENDLL
ncbi:response regulator transcription factor [Flavobacterium sp.]|uniref:response regulator transcription factor n=1 Tax=Flavobacterium sp. TaxID=239 RepID=UPI00286D964B|nr:response regulator transcription factor [Flavobacterium sp.]